MQGVVRQALANYGQVGELSARAGGSTYEEAARRPRVLAERIVEGAVLHREAESTTQDHPPPSERSPSSHIVAATPSPSTPRQGQTQALFYAMHENLRWPAYDPRGLDVYA